MIESTTLTSSTTGWLYPGQVRPALICFFDRADGQEDEIKVRWLQEAALMVSSIHNSIPRYVTQSSKTNGKEDTAGGVTFPRFVSWLLSFRVISDIHPARHRRQAIP